MSNNVIRLLEKSGSFYVPPSGRGRPPLNGLPDVLLFCRGRRSVLLALAVYEHVFRLGDRRGDFMRAVRQVAGEEKLDIETVKRYATRHAALVKDRARLHHEILQMGARQEAAYQSLPRAVRESLPENLSCSGLLALAEECKSRTVAEVLALLDHLQRR